MGVPVSFAWAELTKTMCLGIGSFARFNEQKKLISSDRCPSFEHMTSAALVFAWGQSDAPLLDSSALTSLIICCLASIIGVSIWSRLAK